MMAKKAVVPLLLLVIFLPALYHSSFMTASPSAESAYASLSPESPSQWDIDVLLSSRGKYRVRESDTTYLGTYSLKALWRGCMEKDEDDFLLFHESCELLEWDIQEVAQFPSSTILLTRKDFPDKPAFDFRYLLHRGNEIHLDFVIRGFSVPRVRSKNTFYLDLPTSKENSESSSVVYNFYISKGSNKVSLDSETISRDHVEKTFKWSWNHQKWFPSAEETVFFSNTHDVEVTLTVIPRYDRKK
jgi:hypothetical protein